MTADEKLAALLAAVQTDPGNRGLARDPHDNLFTAAAGDFQRACHALQSVSWNVLVFTGFYIPTADPPSFETDGPLGAAFLVRALRLLGVDATLLAEAPVLQATSTVIANDIPVGEPVQEPLLEPFCIAIERAGPAADGVCRTMRGRNISSHVGRVNRLALSLRQSIGIGDGGNEIGMGKILHDTVVRNIPNGDRIHCRVPCDHLIVAGVSNWGAYALAAGVFVLRGVTPPADLFDSDREREILEVMVREGPLVDGVTGQQTATVDGLTWDEYAAPLIRIREILES